MSGGAGGIGGDGAERTAFLALAAMALLLIGQLGDTVLNVALKRIVREPRPIEASDEGLPCAVRGQSASCGVCGPGCNVAAPSFIPSFLPRQFRRFNPNSRRHLTWPRHATPRRGRLRTSHAACCTLHARRQDRWKSRKLRLAEQPRAVHVLRRGSDRDGCRRERTGYKGKSSDGSGGSGGGSPRGSRGMESRRARVSHLGTSDRWRGRRSRRGCSVRTCHYREESRRNRGVVAVVVQFCMISNLRMLYKKTTWSSMFNVLAFPHRRNAAKEIWKSIPIFLFAEKTPVNSGLTHRSLP